MSTFRAALLGTVLAIGGAVAADAAVIVNSAIGGAPTAVGVTRDNFDNLAPGSSGVFARSGYTLTITPGAQVASGNVGGQYAAPVLSGANGNGFGSPDQPDGVNATPYLTSGSTGSVAASAITFSFSAPQSYLGVLWGSVDAYNSILFYSGATLLATVTGNDVNAVIPNGSQAADGTAYVNLSASNAASAFDRVVFRSSQFAFEFDNVAFAPFVPTGVPVPASLALLGMGLLGLVAARRRPAHA
ncbi:PEP-CTERM sorting domain-containing protein [Roseococcus sp. DSY-14]|uniref:Npun_F0296 family exosortase-dependent surface protein n=1 Tax=Roseococcus sp. DSY-14 TaxID=3369650 RepID=UPI00387B4499